MQLLHVSITGDAQKRRTRVPRVVDALPLRAADSQRITSCGKNRNYSLNGNSITFALDLDRKR